MPVPSVQIQIVIFAVIAAVVLFQLYNVLGKKVGRQPEDAKAAPGVAQPAPGQAQLQAQPLLDPATEAAAAELKARDPGFDVPRFLEGARQAYETIVRAYASGDRETLRPLLAAPVMTSFEAGIAARPPEHNETVEFAHTPRADLEHADAVGDTARAKVRFLAELRSRVAAPDGEEAVEERRTAEFWTFERPIGAPDPNWVLARVEPAAA